MKKILLLTEGTSTFARDLLLGVADFSAIHGPWAFYRESLTPFYRRSSRVQSLTHLKSLDVDGLIIRSGDERLLNQVYDLGVPIVACDDDNQIPDVPNVVTDNERIGKLGGEHFLSRGFSHFAYCGFDDLRWSEGRGGSFERVVGRAGFKVIHYPYPKAGLQRLWENELPRICRWLDSLPKPIALMGCNDDRANELVMACHLLGFRVPEDVAVLGVDNDDLLCRMSDPPISSVAIDTRKAGFEAASLLDRMIRGEDVAGEVVYARPTHITTRRSTDTLAIDDHDMVQAIRFIREHVRESLLVTDVAEAVAVSQRTLFEKFKKHLGRSVHDEIKRVRVEDISQMLLQTDLNVRQIAELFHFSGTEHIARYFRQVTGMTPLAYREAYSEGNLDVLVGLD